MNYRIGFHLQQWAYKHTIDHDCMNPPQLAMIVKRGQPETYDTLLREFAPKGFRVFWDRRFAERRRSNIPVAVERRINPRRQDADTWNVQQFRVVLLREPPVTR